MRNHRIPVLAVALVLAGLCALVTLNYVNSADQRAEGDAELVEAFVVKKDIPKGLPGEAALEEGYVAGERLPRKLRPATAVSDLQALRGKVALAPLAAGLPLVGGAFVEPSLASESFAQRIHPGMQAVTLSVSEVEGVARLVVPGDRVNLLVTTENDTAGAAPAAGEPTRMTAVALQGIEVLAVGNSAVPVPGQALPVSASAEAGTVPILESSLITFEVPALDAVRIVHASHLGSVHLTLLPEDFTPAPVPQVTRDNLFS